MSLNVLTQGGGTGGESASIFVRGLSPTDTVTATKGSKTVNGKWGSKTAYEIKPLIPVMTSDTTPSGVASASNINGTSNEPYMAFRNKVSTATGDCTQSSYAATLPWWIGYEFPDEQELTHFEVYFVYPDSSYSKGSTGYISVSDDGGVTWKQVASFSNLAQDTIHAITLENTVKCKMFRIYLTAYNNTYSTGTCRIGMVQAYGLVPCVVNGHIITIKDYGLWTVTATNGEETTTQDVLVDAAVEFTIPLSLSA